VTFIKLQTQEPEKRTYIIHCTAIFRNVLSRDLWNSLRPLEIPGCPAVVHLDHVENH